MLESLGNDSVRPKQAVNFGSPKSPSQFEIFPLKNHTMTMMSGGGGNGNNHQQQQHAEFRVKRGTFELYNKDPMWQALYDNLGSLHSNMLDILDRANALEKAYRVFCHECLSFSSFLNQFNNNNIHQFHNSMNNGLEKSLEGFVEVLALKVYEPIKVNVNVVCEIAERAKRRERMGNKTSKEYNDITLALFDELTALNTHSDNFLRGPFDSLRSCQQKFFEEMDQAINGKKDGNLNARVVMNPTLLFDKKEEKKSTNAVFVKKDAKFDIKKDRFYERKVDKIEQQEEEEDVFETV